MARRRAALTQQELGEGGGCGQATVARWERGDREPSWGDVGAVAEACGLQLDAHLAQRGSLVVGGDRGGAHAVAGGACAPGVECPKTRTSSPS